MESQSGGSVDLSYSLYFQDKYIDEKNLTPNTSDLLRLFNVFNLPMGLGKTKMITPIVVFRLMAYLNLTKQPDNIYIILPDSLVKQSYNVFNKYISIYHPITVYIVNEYRKGIENKDYI